MKKLNGTWIPAMIAFAWAVSASAEMILSWAGERQGVARAVIAGESTPAVAQDAREAEGTPDERAAVTQEEYLAVAGAAAEEAAVDELSRRMVEGLFGGAVDGDGTGYGESALPGGSDGSARVDGMVVVRGTAERAERGVFWAADNSENAVYEKGQDWMGLNGGRGFGAWREGTGSAAPAVRTISNDGGFRVQANAQAGEIAMVRDLNTDLGLTSGEFKVTVWGAAGGADERGDFSGIAVYGANDSELFRWGVRQDKLRSTFSYSLDGGDSYTEIEDGYPGVGVDYTLTWGVVDGATRFTLAAQANGVEGMDPYFSGLAVSLGSSERVMAVAALLTESGAHASEMTFDNLSVAGVEPAVPEPGVLGLLAAGAAALFRRKAEQAK